MVYLELFLTFLKIGAFTFGGGYAMLPLVQSEVLRHGWMTASQLVDFVAVSESTPGSFAVNVSTYVGATVGGIPGAFCATAAVVLPSFIIILIVARCYVKFQNSRTVKGIMSGLNPCVVGLIASAAVSVALTVFFPQGCSVLTVASYAFICSAVIFAVMVILVFKKIHPILIIVLSAALGIAAGYLENVIHV